MSLDVVPKAGADEEAGDRHTKFRILKVSGRKRAFSLEPVFWNILEEAARHSTMRLGDYVARVLDSAGSGNHSSQLRSHAAEWAAEQAERLRDKGLIALGRRVAMTHTAPAFVMDQHRAVIAFNKSFEDLISSGPLPLHSNRLQIMDLRVGVPMAEVSRVLRIHPEKFLRANFAARCGGLERSGALNIMLLGDERDQTLFLCLVRSIEEARRCA